MTLETDQTKIYQFCMSLGLKLDTPTNPKHDSCRTTILPNTVTALQVIWFGYEQKWVMLQCDLSSKTSVEKATHWITAIGVPNEHINLSKISKLASNQLAAVYAQYAAMTHKSLKPN